MEVQIGESMPYLASLCTNEQLRSLILRHAGQNRIQIAEINAVFERHGKSTGGDRCKAMAGLIEGGTAYLEKELSLPTRDLMLAAHCLRIERYEMAAYEFAALLSFRLGLMREPTILKGFFEEEMVMAAALISLEPTLFDTAYCHA